MGLETKHYERDLAIPKHREELLDAIQKDLKNDANVLAVYYGGSIGNENTDLYSDIDLRIVVKDDVFEEYRLNKKQRATNWGKVLFFEDFPWASHSIAHYHSFIKVDSFYYKTRDLQPPVWLQNIKIVHDTDNLMKDILEESMKLSYQPNVQEVEIWRTKFFASVQEAYRRIMRKEIYYALHFLDNLRLSMVAAWFMDAGIQPNTFGDWAKLEGDRSKLLDWQLELLEKWHSNRDPNNIMNVIKSIIPEFIKVHESLCVKVRIEENSEWVDEIFKMVI
ncbi:aminoglycoside 6-adenylyltransferase [Lederbergia citri]|uniref:Aminoglycoside 6-adenylyltransferase n=1 Tax=Lederbergia citri TaxID=2833580 RepID=A0A942TH95_9BACI|nr:aminoglycoside 6-adenylyltransferase [Lederbergia citri]MBS4196079.1 aminoglycoside 6-adenylyltransferase [Lederbergia citri]